MRFVCLAYFDEKRFEALPKSELDAIVSRCPAYDQALRATGHLIMQASLDGTRATKCIRPNSGKVTITDGPFAETKEQVGGFFLIEARDIDEAVRVASNHPAAHLGEQLGWGVEVRPIDMFEQSQPDPPERVP